jgi:hypothetical protein
MGILQYLRERFGGSREQGDASRSQGDASRSLPGKQRSISDDVTAAFKEALKLPYLDPRLVPSKFGDGGLGEVEQGWINKVGRIFDILKSRGYPRLNETILGPKTHGMRLGQAILDITDILEEKSQPKKSDDQIA